MSCPHGLDRGRCEICRVIDPTVLPATPRARRPDRPRSLRGGLATIAVVAVVGFLLVGWVAADFFAVLRIVELLAVALVAGWVGWQLGVRHGRRESR